MALTVFEPAKDIILKRSMLCVGLLRIHPKILLIHSVELSERVLTTNSSATTGRALELSLSMSWSAKSRFCSGVFRKSVSN